MEWNFNGILIRKGWFIKIRETLHSSQYAGDPLSQWAKLQIQVL